MHYYGLNLFFTEAERFDKDFAVADKKVREQKVDHFHTKLNHLR
jgi:hypothetical protein